LRNLTHTLGTLDHHLKRRVRKAHLIEKPLMAFVEGKQTRESARI